MRRIRDYRSGVIGAELVVLALLAGALYVEQRPAELSPKIAPTTATTTVEVSTTSASVATTTPLSDKGGIATTTMTRPANVWQGTTTAQGLHPYIEVVDGCGPHYEGTCLNARGGPGTTYPVVGQLRNGMVLPVAARVSHDGEVWYQVDFKDYRYLLYPERVEHEWYVNDRYVKLVYDPGEEASWKNGATTTDKRIVVDRATQMLYAYDGDTLYMSAPVSTGLDLTPTPRGNFTVFMKTPSSYMQGPSPTLPLKQFYDLPGVPWDLFFTKQGAVIHGAYWHNAFGSQYSHGCVNLSPADSHKLYQWAVLGTEVSIID